MSNKYIWMALIIENTQVVFSNACETRKNAKNKILEYLCKNYDVECSDFTEACMLIADDDLKIDFIMFEMEFNEFSDALKNVFGQQANLSIDGNKHSKKNNNNLSTIKKNEIADKITSIIEGLDIGGEQSMQFSKEIHMLNDVLHDLR